MLAFALKTPNAAQSTKSGTFVFHVFSVFVVTTYMFGNFLLEYVSCGLFVFFLRRGSGTVSRERVVATSDGAPRPDLDFASRSGVPKATLPRHTRTHTHNRANTREQ